MLGLLSERLLSAHCQWAILKRMETLAHVVGGQDLKGAADLLMVRRQRHAALEGEERYQHQFLDRLFIITFSLPCHIIPAMKVLF